MSRIEKALGSMPPQVGSTLPTGNTQIHIRQHRELPGSPLWAQALAQEPTRMAPSCRPGPSSALQKVPAKEKAGMGWWSSSVEKQREAPNLSLSQGRWGRDDTGDLGNKVDRGG